VPVVRGEDLPVTRFADLGISLRAVEPGQPNGFYHAEGNQEDFLGVAGACVLVVAGEERRLGTWDFVHCPAGTEHAFVGAGDGPCVIFMAGARTRGRGVVYPVSEAARRHGAGVETETTSPAEAYAEYPRWQRGRPETWESLPWS